jgi:hypothetical protein
MIGRACQVRKVPQPDSSTRQVRTFRDLFLITELLDSKAESDDVGFEAELARMSCQIERAFRFVEVLKKPPLIHQTEARLIRRYSGYLGRGRTHAARAH